MSGHVSVVFLLLSVLLPETTTSQSENDKVWVMSNQAYAACDTVCSAYNPDYTCDLTTQQTMTSEECGMLWNSDVAGYNSGIHERGNGWPEWPDEAAHGSSAKNWAAPCQFESNGRLWYLVNKDSGSVLDCTTSGSEYQYSLCSCDTGAPPPPPVCVGTAKSFIWEDLLQTEVGKPFVNASLGIDEATLSLKIDVDLDYLGKSAADDNGYLYGTTYVIDFEDYNAHSSDIRSPGTCSNRADVLSGKAWDDIWSYSSTPNELGHVGSDSSYLAYPSGGLWSVSMSPDDECGIIRYSTSLTWDALTSCSSYDGLTKYISSDDQADSITLSGTLYINVVSPFAYQSDYSFYRVYQLLSQPFQIVVSKTVYVLDKVEINLLTIDIIAVYKEDEEKIFKLIVLTESAEYLELSRTDLGEILLGFAAVSDTGLTSNDFKILESAQNTGCLTSKSYICSQLWQITAENAKCVYSEANNADNKKYTDFSGTYTMAFEAKCRQDLTNEDLITYCQDWLTDHDSEIEDPGTGLVVLSADLSWKDTICDPLVFEVQFNANMQFYQDFLFVNIASDTHLYQVGQDTVYVRITTSYPSDHFTVFETELVNVWICTFNPLESPDAIQVGEQIGGCFSTSKDSDAFEGHDGHIYDRDKDVTLEEFVPDTTSSLQSNVVQFQFVVPDSVVRDKVYVHAQIEVSLTIAGSRRRILMDAQITKEANQMDHFVDKVGIKRSAPNPINNYPQQPQPQIPPQLPSVKPFVLSLKSSWLVFIACLLVLVLTVNIIIMCYMNCIRDKRASYSRVKFQDSEFDECSERAAINVASD